MPLFTKITEIKAGKKPGYANCCIKSGKTQTCAVGRV